MKEIRTVLAAALEPQPARLAAQRAFLRKRQQLWNAIQEGRWKTQIEGS